MFIKPVNIMVEDIMTKRVIMIDINKTLLDAGKKMANTRTGSIIITKENKPVGIITDSDIIKNVIAKNLKPSEIKIRDLMSSPLITVNPKEDIIEAERKMRKNKVKRLPVVDNGKLVGILTASDIARTCPEMLSLLQYRLEMRESMPEIMEESFSGICEACGNYSENLKFENEQWICESCREV